MGILAAGNADQHRVAFLNHVVVGDGLAGFAQEPFFNALQGVGAFHGRFLVT
ncbi:hypothetical protein SDC9_201220 [bioreactor metagenome]|uniref:Uncharacterized protein n=1 Tax=bioreactor metagenome TaxID=1076179 RepID=A0A645IR28_9ZZZZ